MSDVTKVTLMRYELLRIIAILEKEARISGDEDLLEYLRKQSEATETIDSMPSDTKEAV